MDWSLVLASQGIEALIERTEPEAQWFLVIEAADRERALDSIKRFRLENRRWARRFSPVPGAVRFHAGGFLWAWCLMIWHWLADATGGRLDAAGVMNGNCLKTGEWWRTITATTLHADVGHLSTNLATGTLLLGLCIPLYGAGPALLLGSLAGAGGNLLALALRTDAWQGLGASGTVLGWLGLLTAHSLGARTKEPASARMRFAPMFGGTLLFILLGVDPRADVLAHTGGFLSGVVLGLAFMALSTRFGHPSGIKRASSVGLAALLGWSWASAWLHS